MFVSSVGKGLHWYQRGQEFRYHMGLFFFTAIVVFFIAKIAFIFSAVITTSRSTITSK